MLNFYLIIICSYFFCRTKNMHCHLIAKFILNREQVKMPIDIKPYLKLKYMHSNVIFVLQNQMHSHKHCTHILYL